MFTDNEDATTYMTHQVSAGDSMPEMPEVLRSGVARQPLSATPRVQTEVVADGRPGDALWLEAPSSTKAGVPRASLRNAIVVAADVWSATSYVELRREALSVGQLGNRLHPGEAPRVPYVTQILKGAKGPIIAASDYMKAVPEMVSAGSMT